MGNKAHPYKLGVTQTGWLTLNSPLDAKRRFQNEAGKELKLSTSALGQYVARYMLQADGAPAANSEIIVVHVACRAHGSTYALGQKISRN